MTSYLYLKVLYHFYIFFVDFIKLLLTDRYTTNKHLGLNEKQIFTMHYSKNVMPFSFDYTAIWYLTVV